MRLHLSNNENMRRFKRLHAIFTGFAISLIMTMAVAICAMGRRNPEQGLYIKFSIVACLWIEIAIMWAAHYSTKVWPTVLIYVTTLAYAAIGLTLALRDDVVFAYQRWLLCVIWLCLGVVTVGG
jgi:lipopolysaccharide export LptBFGC system permease protein LptF